MFRVVVLCAAALWAGAAMAADQPEYAPPGAWVQPAAIPKAPAATDGSPVQMLLVDEQSRLGADSDELYVERALKILSPEGLNISSALGKTWDPDTETLVIHHLNIIRGDTVIDVLAGGKKFIVLRRENNLELAMLDGRLTATIQPEGLQVGDIVDLATTIRRRDPALQGYSLEVDGLAHTGVASRVRMRAIWPASKPIRWRTTEGLDQPKITKTAEGSELVIDMTNVETPKPPVGAPARFYDLGVLELSQFADWAELSRLMAPLYQKAAAIQPGSPLVAEVAKIAAASSDPKVRAAAALRLVEDQTRYVFLGMNDGGLVPADADATWSRRFGDCKGKTALLVALLKGLGIEAEPALVSTVFGDGLDQRLPMTAFDHVIVRAQIGGKTYWLDGTRVGDRSLDDLVVPPFRWALPVRTGGAALVRLEPAPLMQPDTEEFMKIDASKGPTTPAPTHIDLTYRGEAAAAHRQELASVPHADYERYVREFWTKTYPWLDVANVGESEDPTANTTHLTADGFARMDWTQAPDGSRFYRVPTTVMAAAVNFKREPGPHQDAPYGVTFPYFGRTVRQIVLPLDGDFVLVGADIDKTVAGLELHRRSRIDTGLLTVEMSTRSTEWEFPASEATADGETLSVLARQDVSVVYRTANGAVAAPKSTQTSTSDQAAADGGDAAAQFRLGQLYAQGRGVPFDLPQAMAWFRKSADQGYAQAQSALGVSYYTGSGVTRDYAQALVWLGKAAAQNDANAEAALAYMYASGVGVAHDQSQAFLWAQKAAAQGVSSGELLLGAFYKLGVATPKDPVQSFDWYRKAADQGVPNAEVEVAYAYRAGRGVAKDPKQAFAWAQKAADQGDMGGETYLGELYRGGDGGTPDYAQALAWFHKGADQGDVTAELDIAGLYWAGWGVPKDPVQSYDWVRKAANQGSARAENELGHAYESGQGLPRDYPQPLIWLNKAAAQGEASAENSLGIMYENGEGVPHDPSQALDWYRKSAAQNHAAAQYNIGGMYFKGDGVEQDYAQAETWYRKAADQDFAAGQYYLGLMYAAGHGVAKDEAVADSWFHKAADQNYEPAEATLAANALGRGTPEDLAQALALYQKAADRGVANSEMEVGLFYLNGTGIAKNSRQAIAWLTKAADQGLPHAMEVLGKIYDEGLGVPPDSALALTWMRKAADLGAPIEQARLGQLYMTGKGVPVDQAQAAVWMEKAAQQGFVYAQISLGGMYGRGQGVAHDEVKATAWYLKAAEQGDASAQMLVAARYMWGVGMTQDGAQALTWFRKAADQGDAAAEAELGSMYENGRGTPVDYAQALVFLSKAADKGNASAQINLGVLYDHGRGVPQDFAQAMAWYRKSAAQEYPLGETNVGVMYREARGVPRDYAQAVALFRKAADKGEVHAEYLLGLAYLNGESVPVDKAQAAVWFAKAAAQGDAGARQQLAALRGAGPPISTASAAP